MKLNLKKDINTTDAFNSVQYSGSCGVKLNKKKTKAKKPSSSSKGSKKKVQKINRQNSNGCSTISLALFQLLFLRMEYKRFSG